MAILVTMAEFGPSAPGFVAGKPLTLIGGIQLVDLLAQYGVRTIHRALSRFFLGELAESNLAVWLSLPISWT